MKKCDKTELLAVILFLNIVNTFVCLFVSNQPGNKLWLWWAAIITFSYIASCFIDD